MVLVVAPSQVQIIPWVISDSNFVRCPSYQLDPAKTVFVGALHGMLSAEGLASIMNDLFGGVVYCGKLSYYTCNNNNENYMKHMYLDTCKTPQKY